MDKDKNKCCEFCSKDEYDRFLSIYNRLYQIKKGPGKNSDDFLQKQTELAEDIKSFWPIMEKVAGNFGIDLSGRFNTIMDVIYQRNVEYPKIDNVYRPLRFFTESKKRQRSQNEADQQYIAKQNSMEGNIQGLFQDLARLKAGLEKYFGQTGKDTVQKPAEPEQNATAAKHWGIPTRLGKILEKVLYIFTKSFWDSLWERMGPK